ncbi:MAG: hypothetical protein GXP55_08760 [Deltaproteobacteria bacterium]|nr:hypothetical protein [Deltaproteobacteria bacterium]
MDSHTLAILNILLGTSMVSALALLGTTRLRTCARVLAGQGLAVGLLPALMSDEQFTIRIVVLMVGNIVLKAVVFPWLLLRVCRDVSVRRDPGAFIGTGAAVLVGVLCLGIAAWLGTMVGASLPSHPAGVYIVAFFLILTGLLLIIVRRRAVMQVMGYLTLENGIYLFGSCAVIGVPFLLEFGVLLDVFAAIFVMGAALRQIHAQFSSDDATKLSELSG